MKSFIGLVSAASFRALWRTIYDLVLRPFKAEISVHSAGGCTWEYDVSGDVVVLSEGWASLMLEPRRRTYTTLRQITKRLNPEDVSRGKRIMTTVIREGLDEYVLEHRVTRADGSVIWILSRGCVTARHPVTGRALRLTGINLDVTRCKVNHRDHSIRATRFERALLAVLACDREDISSFLRSTAEIAARVGELMEVGFWLLDETGQHLVCKALYDADSETYDSGNSVLPADHVRSLGGSTINQTVNTGESSVVSLLDPLETGPVLDFALGLKGNLLGMMRFVRRDTVGSWPSETVQFGKTLVTKVAQIIADQTQLANQRMSAALFEHCPVGIALISPDEKFIRCNERMNCMFGYESGMLLGQSTRVLHASDECWKEHPHHADTVFESELPMQRRTGELIWVLLKQCALKPGDPRAGALVTYTDITEQKQQQLELAQAKDRLELVISVSGQTVYDYDVKTAKLTVFSAPVHYERGLLLEVPLEKAFRALHPHDRAEVRKAVHRALENEADLFEWEFRAKTRSGEWAWYKFTGKRVQQRVPGSKPVRVIGTSFNISRIKQTEHALETLNKTLEAQVELRTQAQVQSEARFRAVFDGAPLGIALIGLDRCLITANQRACDFLGYELDELVGRDLSGITHPDDWAVQRPLVLQLSKGLIPRYTMEKRYINREGQLIWAKISASLVTDANGTPLYTVVILEEISALKLANQKLQEYAEQVSTLTRRVMSVQEKERQHIARELHDEIGQVLTAVRLALVPSHRRTDKQTPTDTLAVARAVVDEAIDRVRDLIMNLRPPMLDDLGLLAALRSLCDQYRQRSQIQVHFESTADLLTLPRDLSDTIYRITQEALTNIVRHSQASVATVRLGKREDYIVLIVRDDGIGFHTETLRDKRGLGIVGMRERIKLHGGRLEILSAPGKGSELLVMFSEQHNDLSEHDFEDIQFSRRT